MIFQHTIDAVLNEEKTQTSRIFKEGDFSVQSNDGTGWVINAYTGRHRVKYRHGNTYAVQPGRGQRAVARIKIIKIRLMDVRGFTVDEYKNEGFISGLRFMSLWIQMHGKSYRAWILNFELVK